jgi:hypothetical protein
VRVLNCQFEVAEEGTERFVNEATTEPITQDLASENAKIKANKPSRAIIEFLGVINFAYELNIITR